MKVKVTKVNLSGIYVGSKWGKIKTGQVTMVTAIQNPCSFSECREKGKSCDGTSYYVRGRTGRVCSKNVEIGSDLTLDRILGLI